MSEGPKTSEASLPGDRQAVREVQGLFLTHIDVIRGFIRALVRDSHLADDVLQETFLTVVRKADRFQAGTSFPKWACAVARLKVLECRRQSAGRLTFLSEEALEALVEDHQPDTREEHEQALRVVEECVALLPPSMKKMIDLRYMVGRKPAEIAGIVGWTVEAVYVSLSRARANLRECIEGKRSRLQT